MGNIEQKFAESKPIEDFADRLKHTEQTRSDSQVEITTKLANLLSDLNAERILKNGNLNSQVKDWSQYVFVCIQGLPAVKDQFQILGLPGQTIYFSAINFSPEAQKQDEQKRKQFVYKSDFKMQAARLNSLFNSITKNKIILVYHSAGNFILSMYFYYYGYELAKKIVGMIDVGGAPLRYYLSAKILVTMILQADFQEIMANSDKIHDFFMKSISKSGFDLGFRSKYQTLSFLRYIKSPNYGQIFQATWHHPKVLKMFIHGRRDTLFQQALLSQKVIYYTYRTELQQQYQQKMKKKYKQLYGADQTVDKVQQRFILGIPRGQHSIHRQPKNYDLIRKAVQQYLLIIHQ